MKTNLLIMNKKAKYIYLIIALVIVAFVTVFFILKSINNKAEVTDIEITQNQLDIVYGEQSAKVHIFLFSNYGCSFCRKFYSNVLPQLKKDFIDKGNVQLIIKPISFEQDEYARKSLKIVSCINKYGNVEKIHQLLLAQQSVIYTKEFNQVVDELIEKDEFVAECMFGGEADKYVVETYLLFTKLNLSGTPSFVINNHIYKGYRNYNELKKIIKKLL